MNIHDFSYNYAVPLFILPCEKTCWELGRHQHDLRFCTQNKGQKHIQALKFVLVELHNLAHNDQSVQHLRAAKQPLGAPTLRPVGT